LLLYAQNSSTDDQPLFLPTIKTSLFPSVLRYLQHQPVNRLIWKVDALSLYVRKEIVWISMCAGRFFLASFTTGFVYFALGLELPTYSPPTSVPSRTDQTWVVAHLKTNHPSTELLLPLLLFLNTKFHHNLYTSNSIWLDSFPIF
jgi:hypothetical protein